MKVIKKGGGNRPYDALATLGLSRYPSGSEKVLNSTYPKLDLGPVKVMAGLYGKDNKRIGIPILLDIMYKIPMNLG